MKKCENIFSDVVLINSTVGSGYERTLSLIVTHGRKKNVDGNFSEYSKKTSD